MCLDCRKYPWDSLPYWDNATPTYWDWSWYVRIEWKSDGKFGKPMINGARKLCSKCGGWFVPDAIIFHETFCEYCKTRVVRIVISEGFKFEEFMRCPDPAVSARLLTILQRDSSVEYD